MEKFQAQAAMKAGDMDAAQAHAAEAKRLQQAVAGDAVERVQEGPKEKKRGEDGGDDDHIRYCTLNRKPPPPSNHANTCQHNLG